MTNVTRNAMVDALRDTLDDAIARVYPDGNAPDFARGMLGLIDTASYEVTRPRTGTMREWMDAHHGKPIHTIQIDTAKPASAWIPGARMVDSETARGTVYLNSSAREYKGCRIEHMTDYLLIVSTAFGDGRQVIAYVTDELA